MTSVLLLMANIIARMSLLLYAELVVDSQVIVICAIVDCSLCDHQLASIEYKRVSGYFGLFSQNPNETATEIRENETFEIRESN